MFNLRKAQKKKTEINYMMEVAQKHKKKLENGEEVE